MELMVKMCQVIVLVLIVIVLIKIVFGNHGIYINVREGNVDSWMPIKY